MNPYRDKNGRYAGKPAESFKEDDFIKVAKKFGTLPDSLGRGVKALNRARYAIIFAITLAYEVAEIAEIPAGKQNKYVNLLIDKVEKYMAERWGLQIDKL